MTRLPLLSVALVSLALVASACDKKPDEAKKSDKKADADKKADSDKKAGAEKAEGEKADAKKADAKKHFDISADKSGVLARSAAALEATEAVAEFADEDLAVLSHHAEKLPSADDVCEHISEVRHGGDQAACVKEMEHHIVRLGPELYSFAAGCLMEAKTSEDIDLCVEAEVEAELLLHEKAHGDGLEQEVCDAFFAHFEKLAMEDAGEDHAEIVKEVLEEVRVDVLAACVDQGAKAEIECAMTAETLPALKDCASKLL